MNDNEMKLDCTTPEKIKFSGKFWVLLIFSIMVTFVLSLIAVFYLTVGVKEQLWNEIGVNGFAANCLFWLVC